jgi:hypothetical protein
MYLSSYHASLLRMEIATILGDEQNSLYLGYPVDTQLHCNHIHIVGGLQLECRFEAYNLSHFNHSRATSGIHLYEVEDLMDIRVYLCLADICACSYNAAIEVNKRVRYFW